MTQNNTQHYKKKLEEEMALVVEELQTVGRINPDNPDDWEAVADEFNAPASADLNEEADDVEAFGENVAILDQLETRFNEIKDALRRIEDKEYGVCRVCGNEIEQDRLEANPAAETCKEHIND